MSDLEQCQVHSEENCDFCSQCGLPTCPSCDPLGRACPLIHDGDPHWGLRPSKGVFYEYYDFGDGQEVLTGRTFTSAIEYSKGIPHRERLAPPSREALQVPELRPPWVSKTD